MPCGGHVGGRVAELAAALVALDDLAAHGERAAERLGGALDVAGGQAVADVRRGPHLRAAVEGDALGGEVVVAARARRSVPTSPAAFAPNRKFAPDHDGPRRAARPTRTSLDEPLRGPGAPRRGRTAATSTSSAPAACEQRGAASRAWSASAGACSGRSTAIGCGSKVTATTGRPPSSAATSRARPTTCWCPRCTPSKLPTVTTVAAEVGGHLVERAPDLHGDLLLSALAVGDPESSHSGSDEDRHGGGDVAALLVEREEASRPGRTPRPGRLAGEVEVERAAEADVARPAPRRGRTAGSSAGPRRRSAAASNALAPARRAVCASASVERPDGGTPQRGQVAADAERARRGRGRSPGRRCRCCSAPRRRRRARRRPARTSVDDAARGR